MAPLILGFDPRAGAEVAARFADLPEAQFLGEVAGGAPYLRGLMLREEVFLRAALTAEVAEVVPAEIALLLDLPLDSLARDLRRAKRRMALWTGLCDLGGVWDLEAVTGALTDLADACVAVCVQRLVEDEVRRGKLPDATGAGGMVVLAMGKMGAGELNYSSDIDLICLYDEGRYPGGEAEARGCFVRVVRRMTALLSDITAEGYVFRVDLRLRPDASVTPVCLSMAAAEAYYEAEGRTWERAAFIKARVCGGDPVAGARFLKGLVPFVWRKHLDFAAIQDAHDMRLRIRAHRGLKGAVAVEGHDLKLGRGGIREIEFFTQTRQLIAGGRDIDLRLRGTVPGLRALAAKGWIPPMVAEALAAAYRAHRALEHRLQMVLDEQTHRLPVTAEGIARVAALSGLTEAAFRADLLQRLSDVAVLTEGFFTPMAAEAAPDLSDRARGIVDRWWRFPALRSERAQAIFRRLLPVILHKLTAATHGDEALLALDGFLGGLPSGVQIFSLFDANPALIDLIIDIAATSPGLARHLARHAGVLDAVIGGSFFAPWPGAIALTEDLVARLAGIADYERALDAARAWRGEWHFRVGVHHLRGLVNGHEAGAQYADLAQAVVMALWPVVGRAFAVRHGPPPGRGAVVVAMGSLGAGRLTAGSDLDLIVIYDAAGVAASDGVKPLAAQTYYARLTQSLVTALTVPMAEGRLYEVDMRLRPSGRQGPVATSVQSFRAYQMDEAWTWEHLALTRARVLAGDTGLAAEVEQLRCAVLVAKSTGATVVRDVADMRARLAEARPGLGSLEAKAGPGKMMDVEMFAQMLALQCACGARGVEAQVAAGIAGGKVSQTEATAVLDAYSMCWRLRVSLRLIADQGAGSVDLGQGAAEFVLRETGETSVAALMARLAEVARVADAVISARLG